ncbi:uncharacterized protein LOC126772576 [Nymphalis io]|uniref:uncharacterized protein LOC126772576 n=1 Tax=Inachis io TaxID=171585 RepID=UPI0021687837|nr:uncharacterized protein LOC126772576 [Nymphalis io]
MQTSKKLCQIYEGDASLLKNKPCSTTVNEYLIKDDINQVEKEFFHGINGEASSFTHSRKYKSNISEDTSQTQNKPHSTTVNEDLIKNGINQVDKQFCHGINGEANSSIDKSNNTTDISRITSITKNNSHYTKLNDELLKNETNELEKGFCHEKSEEANSYIDEIYNTSNISKNISLTKIKPQYTTLNDELVKNEIKQLEKEFEINGEANSFTDSRKYKTNTIKNTSQTKNKPHSTRVYEDMIKNEIKRLEREFCHIINGKANTSTDNRKSTKKCTNCNSITKDKTYSKNMNDECIKQCKRDTCHVINKDANSSADNNEYTKYNSKDISLKKDKIAWNNQNKAFTKSSTHHHIHSVAINYKPKENNFREEKYLPKEKISEENRLPKEHSLTKEHSLPKDTFLPEENDLTKENYSPEKSKLSAQIINLPFNDFRDSLSVNSSQTNVSSSNFNKIIKSDFLTKLKEIYNACSCKVCECISGKFLSTNDNICNCKACECDECTKYARNFKHDLKYAPHSGCPCVSCDRKDCRGVVKNEQDERKCDCSPCDCVKCWDFASKPCSCEPCQCTECNALGASLLRTVVVAPVQGNFQQNMCQCEPCECINCTHNYTAMASNLRRQVSTEIISHAVCHCETCSNDTCQSNGEVCRCDMHSKLMKKPNERASPDYDIHRAIINCQEGKGQFNSHDTIVTYALSNNDYSNLKSNSKSNCDDCKCLNCECIKCEGKYKILNKCPKPYHDSFNTCKCSTCECQICSKINEQKNAEVNRFRFQCGCNKCNCFDCKTLPNYANDSNNTIATNNNLCKMCYPAKKGKLLSPSMFDTHMSSVSKLTSCTSNQFKKETKNNSYFNVSANDYFYRKPSHDKNVTVCHTESKHNNMESVYEKNIIFDVSEYPSKIIASDNEYYQNDLKKIEEIYEKENITILSKNSTYNNTRDKLCEIFNTRNQKPIRDIELLEKYIYLPNMLPKTNATIKKSTINSDNASSQILSNDIAETCLIDRNLVPCIFQNTSKELVYTNPPSAVSTEDINLNETCTFKTFHTNSSKSIMLFDKKSSSIHIESHDYENPFINMNKINDNNDLKKDFEDTSDINPVDCLGATYNSSSTFTANSNEIVNLKNGMVNKNCEVEEKKRFTAISMTKLSKHNVHKCSKKFKGKKYNKLYSRIMNCKVNENNIIQTNQTNIVPEENTIFESVKKDLLSINDDEVESLDYNVKNKSDLIFQSKVSSTASINKLLTSRNIFCKNLNTEIQNNNAKDNIAWPIMRKNLYLSCADVAKSNGTIPAMEFDIKKTLKSISLQTSESVNKIETSNGKRALTRLLIEVHNLLNLPLLQSSHVNMSPDTKQESNYVSKSELDLEIQTVHSNLTKSKCNSIDKETYCNLIRSMEMLQENITSLMENVLTNAVYKSELLTPKLNLEQGPTHYIPTINSAKSSCHGFKATFIGLRTISDHTVMVKWRLPREVIYVQGYELQVDGRPVQKIFSPTRCMAILTCLPHSEKLLLTIRTLITSNLPFDHQPAATIVYRPRFKGNAIYSK